MSDREILYKQIIIELLSKYIDDKENLIAEYSGDFEESAKELKQEVMSYLEKIDENEEMFNELVKDSYLFEQAESEV